MKRMTKTKVKKQNFAMLNEIYGHQVFITRNCVTVHGAVCGMIVGSTSNL